MADTVDTRTNSATGPLASLRELAGRNPSTQALWQELENYASAQAQNVLSSTGRKLGEATQRLTTAAEDGGGMGALLTDGARKLAEGKSPGRVALETGGKAVKEKVKTALTGGKSSKGSSATKFNNIVENCDVGVPLRTAYNQWTRYQDFSRFTRGVLSVEHADEVTSNWKLKVAKSKRSLKATTTEQIPDQRIAWTTEGAKGTIKGVVTFHSLEANLTRILLVIEYYPSGFFEKTANMWWAASRRVRLDLKHYRRFVMMNGEETEGWRGEIRDGEVVRSHDEVVEQEQQDDEERSDDQTADSGEHDAETDLDDRGAADEDDEPTDDQDLDDEDEDDEFEDDDEDEHDEDEDEDEDEEDDEDEQDEESAPEREPARAERRRGTSSRR